MLSETVHTDTECCVGSLEDGMLLTVDVSLTPFLGKCFYLSCCVRYDSHF